MCQVKNFKKRKSDAEKRYKKIKSVKCPYLNNEVIFNAKGFHHLQFSAGHERSKRAQLLKFHLFPLAVSVINNSGTVQEYRKELQPFGKKGKRDGLRKTKPVQFWAFVAIVTDQHLKIRVVVRRVGDGNFTFWSVMPDVKKSKTGIQRLYKRGIEDE